MHSSKSNAGTPGKLKHNLNNINVFALLPGMGNPPKKKESSLVTPRPAPPIQKSGSLDLENSTTDSTVKSVTASNGNTVDDDVEILKSVTKTRARGPVKRRPSTKKGREALRKSCIDLTTAMDPTTEDSEIHEPTKMNETFRGELKAKPFFHHPEVASKSSEFASTEEKKKMPFLDAHVRVLRVEKHAFKKDQANDFEERGSSRTSEVPTIVVETLHIAEYKAVCKESDYMVTDNVQRLLKQSSAVHRKSDLPTDPKHHHFDRIDRSYYKSEISLKLDQDARSKGASGFLKFSNFTRGNFMSDLITEQDNQASSLLRRTEHMTNVHESAANRRRTFMSDMILHRDYSDKSNAAGQDMINRVERAEKLGKYNDKKTKLSDSFSNTRNAFFEKEDAENTTAKLEANQSATSATKTSEKSTENAEKLNKHAPYSDRLPTARAAENLEKEASKDAYENHELSVDDKKPDSKSFLSVESGDACHIELARRSSFVRTDNFASPEFIQEENLSDEDTEDVFSERKLPPQSDIWKRSTLVDDDDEDLLVEASPDQQQVSVPESLITPLAKVENVTINQSK